MPRETETASLPPSQGAFFIEGIDKPILVDDGLTLAEITQLSMDREGDPAVQSRLTWFCDEHLDEFKKFSGLLAEYEKVAEELTGHESTYKRMNHSNEDELERFVGSMAAGFIRTKRWALAQRVKNVTEIGEELSARLVKYVQAMFPDQKGLRINGVAYSFEGGVLATRGLSDRDKYLVVFGGEPIVTAHNRDNYNGLRPYKTYARRANPAEWQRLCQDLQTFARF